MHIRVEGMASIDEAMVAIKEAFDMVAEKGITYVSDINFYCAIYDSNRDEREVTDEKGNPISIFYKANPEPKTIRVPANPRSKSNPRFKTKHELRSAP